MKARQKNSKSGCHKISPKHLWIYLKNYKFNSILIRNFLIISLLVMLSNGLLSAFYNNRSEQILQSGISETNMDSLYRSSNMIETVMAEVRSFSYYLSVSDDVQQFIYDDETKTIKSDLLNRLNNIVRLHTLAYNYIDSVYIYSQNSNLILNKGTLSVLDNYSDNSWLETYKTMSGSSFAYVSRRKNDRYPYYISVICSIKSGSKSNIGAVIVNVNVELLGELIGSDRNVAQDLFIFDDSMRLYFCSNKSIMANLDRAPDYLSFLEGKSADFSKVLPVNGEKIIVSFIKSKNYAWNYVLLSPTSTYNEKTKQMNDFMVQMTAIYLVLSLIVSYLLTLKSFEPVRNIMDIIDQPNVFGDKYISKGNRSNEVQHITDLVLKTQEQNSRMRLEMEERLEMLNRAQLSALQSQIDPHFIYNTLDTINWMAIEKGGGENEVSTMISTLAQLLRSSLQRANYLVSVEEEIAYAKLYAKILELRYSDRLQVRWNISSDILLYKTVKFSIQPLVENALSHGLKAKRYQGSIDINGMLSGETVVISVVDDGVGMDEEELIELNEHMENDYRFDDKHVGIRNVNQRIKLLFGDEYGVVITRRGNEGGLTVTILLPKYTED